MNIEEINFNDEVTELFEDELENIVGGINKPDIIKKSMIQISELRSSTSKTNSIKSKK